MGHGVEGGGPPEGVRILFRSRKIMLRQGTGHTCGRGRTSGTLRPVESVTPDLRVVRNASWSEQNGRVIVERVQPAIRDVQSLKDWVHWAWHPKRIRLDELGSSIWRRLDGRATLEEIADAARHEFPDRKGAISERVAEFIAALRALGLVSFDRTGDD